MGQAQWWQAIFMVAWGAIPVSLVDNVVRPWAMKGKAQLPAIPTHFELKPIEKLKRKVSIFSGFDVVLDGAPNYPHISGNYGLRTGMAAAMRNARI